MNSSRPAVSMPNFAACRGGNHLSIRGIIRFPFDWGAVRGAFELRVLIVSLFDSSL